MAKIIGNQDRQAHLDNIVLRRLCYALDISGLSEFDPMHDKNLSVEQKEEWEKIIPVLTLDCYQQIKETGDWKNAAQSAEFPSEQQQKVMTSIKEQADLTPLTWHQAGPDIVYKYRIEALDDKKKFAESAKMVEAADAAREALRNRPTAQDKFFNGLSNFAHIVGEKLHLVRPSKNAGFKLQPETKS